MSFTLIHTGRHKDMTDTREHEHSAHPDFKLVVEADYVGDSDTSKWKPWEKRERHAVIYCDGYVVVTLYEHCYAMWHIADGLVSGGHLWKRNEWRLTAESRSKLVMMFSFDIGSDEPRKLDKDEVTFEWKLQPEDIPYDDAFDSGDPEFDKKRVADIERRLNQNDMTAWCCVDVTATWNGFSETDFIGGVILTEHIADPIAEAKKQFYYLEDEALELLNNLLKKTYDKLKVLA